ncbi:MAG: hypothetical protein ABR571_03705 [Jatrophihabitans sp.]|uniref:hypothetical protein n=1 Tax=Jatrophihabitans sp. TaxID=1932789 RepID=UPI003916A105
MHKRLLWTLPVAVAAVIALPMSSALAAAGGTGHTVTQTDTQHGTWLEPGDTDFCTGETIAVTITGNAVQHVTFFPGGDEVWGTFTETGTAQAVLKSGLSYSGHITIWGNININKQNQNNTFTDSFRLSATGPDGVVHTEIGHEVAHMAWNAVSDQPVVSFDKMWITCT